MNERERFIAAATFQRPDKLPLLTMGPRESTLAAWRRQGLPEGQHWFEAMCRQAGIPYEFPRAPWADPGVNFRMVPMFEEKVLAHRDGHYLVQDWMGNITEIADTFDVTYIREARDFVTRKWHAFPVATHAQFAAMQQRYHPDEPSRFPADFTERVAVLRQRDYPQTISVTGPFWQLREWCGFEPLCMLFLDDPAFVAEMIAFWSDYIAAMLERVFSRYVPDALLVNEDMAYKGASMISPAMTRTHLLPVWRRWIALARQAGVPVVMVDSDGNIDELIPLWIEAGFDMCMPVEVAAGCDLPAYREHFGTQMAYWGGVDKRAIARGGADLEDEMARLAPIARQGGYIPGCDHGMPSDISWSNLLHFGRLWAEMTGW
jgi:uroporphyrinogen decarboxylase